MRATRVETMDRSRWARGPWDDEPDRIEWRTEVGYVGLVHRNAAGALCGYVAVPPGHPRHGVRYQDLFGQHDLDCHGGLTYSGPCQGHICHEPEPGEPEDVWLLGFDCAHCDDVVPEHLWLEANMGWPEVNSGLTEKAYRDVAYVRREVELLALQLRQAEVGLAAGASIAWPGEDE
jgi:hypothetical protein